MVANVMGSKVRHLYPAAAAALAILLLAACGGSNAPGYNPNVSWSGADQGSFTGACMAYASGAYCECALKALAAIYPDAKGMGASPFKAGESVGQDTSQFTACKNGGS